MNTTWSRFNIVSVVFGFAFLYLPIVILVIYSFNESKLVTVWGELEAELARKPASPLRQRIRRLFGLRGG